MSEIKIHRSVKHPNVAQFLHFFEDSENVYILLELCQNQSMNELLKRMATTWDPILQLGSLQSNHIPSQSKGERPLLF